MAPAAPPTSLYVLFVYLGGGSTVEKFATRHSIWNACAAGVIPKEIVETLFQFSKYEVPGHVVVEIRGRRTTRMKRLELFLRRKDGHAKHHGQ